MCDRKDWRGRTARFVAAWRDARKAAAASQMRQRLERSIAAGDAGPFPSGRYSYGKGTSSQLLIGAAGECMEIISDYGTPRVFWFGQISDFSGGQLSIDARITTGLMDERNINFVLATIGGRDVFIDRGSLMEISNDVRGDGKIYSRLFQRFPGGTSAPTQATPADVQLPPAFAHYLPERPLGARIEAIEISKLGFISCTRQGHDLLIRLSSDQMSELLPGMILWACAPPAFDVRLLMVGPHEIIGVTQICEDGVAEGRVPCIGMEFCTLGPELCAARCAR
ncbi:MAG: hypothetical protein SF069_12170 [Phycisphaerae bacterium]|nr:hypothetical protein [Phycisphaerae bacterium]